MKRIKIVIGYDLRISLDSPFNWSEDRKEIYLVKKQVAIPVSIDCNVWEKIKDFAPDALNALGLWNSKREVYESFNIKMEPGNYEIVRIEVSGYAEESVLMSKYFEGIETKNEPLSEDWLFLGYDVADSGFVSCLSNYNHQPSEYEYCLRKDDIINKYHLFNQWSDAAHYRQLKNLDIPDHSPFFIFSLYKSIN